MFSCLMQEQLNAYCDSKTLDLFTVVCSLILKKVGNCCAFFCRFGRVIFGVSAVCKVAMCRNALEKVAVMFQMQMHV